MKIAIPVSTKNETTQMADRFGRSVYYVIYDSDAKAYDFVDNPAIEARSGAGLQAVEFLSTQGVQAVIVPEVGPKADQVLKRLNISIFQGLKIPIFELIEKWKNNQLEEYR